LHSDNLGRRNFKRILKLAGLPISDKQKDVQGFRLYDLRHSCATLLLLSGGNVKVVSARLGHASATMTLDTYAHVLPLMQRQAAAKLQQMLFNPAGKPTNNSTHKLLTN
jgi:integrase